MLRLALYANWYGSLGRVVKEPILFNTNDSRTFRGTGLHAIGRIFGEVVVDEFFWQWCDSFSTPVPLSCRRRLMYFVITDICKRLRYFLAHTFVDFTYMLSLN